MRSRPTLLAVGAVASVLLAACSGASPTPGSSQAGSATAAPSATTVSGEIYVSGSSTVEPISTRVAEKFQALNPEFGYTVEGPGTGDGFALFCNDETDISDASRAIKDEEAQACADNGVEYVEIQIAYDGLSVITSPDNAAISCLSFLDLYALLGPESGPTDTDPDGFQLWSDANALAAELAAQFGTDYGASHAPYPDLDLDETGPGEESGTFDSFVEIVLAKIATARDQESTTRADHSGQANDNVIIEGVAGSPSSLGWVGMAFAEGAVGQVKTIAIDKGAGCVEPTPANVADGSYPISRPLFIYANLARATANPAVEAYVDFYLSDTGIASVTETGYVALPADQLEAARAAWAGR